MNDNTTNHHDSGNPGPAIDAADAYARHLRRCAAMADWVEAELENHALRAKASPGNWGLVGDLAELENLLKRALGHISGMDEASIEDALREHEEA